MKSFREFIAEARRIKVLRTAHYTSRDNKNSILKSGFRGDAIEGAYNPPGTSVIYTTPSSRVGGEYGGSRVHLTLTNPKITSTDSPASDGRRIKDWWRNATDEELVSGKNSPKKAADQAREAISSGSKIVRIPDAHHNPGAHDIKGNYIVVDKDLANRSIDRNPSPIIRAPGKPRRTKIRLPKRP